MDKSEMNHSKSRSFGNARDLCRFRYEVYGNARDLCRFRYEVCATTGFTLLEVILALAILAGAVAVLGELVRIGARNAAAARNQTRAQLLCESLSAEIVVGAVEPDPVQRELVQTDPEWVYSIGIEPVDEEGLVALRVTVEQDMESRRRPAGFSLVRWIPDPGIELPEDEDIEQDATSNEETTGQDTTSGGRDG